MDNNIFNNIKKESKFNKLKNKIHKFLWIQKRTFSNQSTSYSNTINKLSVKLSVLCSNVKASRPGWPRGQNFGLGLSSLASACPRCCYLHLKKCAIQCKIILVVSILWLYHCNIHYKDMVQHSDLGHIFIYVFLALSPCVVIQKYLHMAGLNLGFGLNILASFNIIGAKLRIFRTLKSPICP